MHIDNHPKYHLTFANEEGQKYIFSLIEEYLNRINPLTTFDNPSFAFPTSLEDPDFTTVPLWDLDSAVQDCPLDLPQMDEKDTNDIYSFSGGPFRQSLSLFL